MISLDVSRVVREEVTMSRLQVLLVVLGVILAVAASVVVAEVVEAQEAAPKGRPPYREFKMVSPPRGPIIHPRVSPEIRLCLGPFDRDGNAYPTEDCP